jgi:methylenetetrahydrofolate dehydrogenase (NADP+)/methenyltetrahydrofolate cyclohydrolase
MHNKIIDGNFQSDVLRQQIASEVSKMPIKPRLAVVLVGSNTASQIYVKIKMKRAQEVGIETELHTFEEDISNEQILSSIDNLNQDIRIHGILVQMPLPTHIDKAAVLNEISPDKDVDGFSPINVGLLYSQKPMFIPCTPLGIMHLIKSIKTNLSGLNVAIVGRSNIVGRPVAELLLQSDCTVTILHSKTQNIERICKESDLIVAAAGCPKMITRDHIKPGAIVIDVGITKVDSQIVGDVDFNDVIDLVSHITPVPGGVGPMTVAYLLSNTVKAAKLLS